MKTTIQGTLDELATTLITRDADNKSFKDEYTPEDVMNATHIFSCILNNYGFKRGTMRLDNAEIAGECIADLVKGMAGVDTKTYYKGR